MASNNRNLWIDYLRSSLTVLVVAHHSSLAYTTFGYFDTKTYIKSTHPIVDNSRWIGMDIFVNFNDIFFMSLMFFISGLFVYRGVNKKGRLKFLSERFKRLGIPFIAGVCLIIPVSYIPSYYLNNHSFNISHFTKDYLFNQQFPAGPAWFIWLLLLFNVISVAIPKKFYNYISTITTRLIRKPVRFLVVSYILVCFIFIPISLWVEQYKWSGVGPFDFQLNRILLYFLFYIFGGCIGSDDWENHFFVNVKLLNKPWQLWLTLCLLSYLGVELITYTIWNVARAGKLTVDLAWLIFDFAFVASCIFSSFAFLSIFKQQTCKRSTLWINLSHNAFGIYLIHYVFITWLQFALLKITVPSFIKFLIVFSVTLTISWTIVNFARKYKPFNQIL